MKEEESSSSSWVDVILKVRRQFGEGCDESAALARFVAENAGAFDGGDFEQAEHSLEYTALHKEYLALWEREMETFCRREGIALPELEAQMYDALNDRYTALFEEHPHHGWVDSALAAVSYDHFYARMAAAACGRKK
ncbi:hypothetical protein CTAYLR_001482 [Chrysophaeum taylorii]|uniref:BART domain-containing protein n=1 Tax=Chrysophaeum taylorii TaxID=2483200 RepID=A0AAD7U915_9STRA|nr:hypothetical protein CTAYLR_001482 [Chrysophaeum taylorii]